MPGVPALVVFAVLSPSSPSNATREACLAKETDVECAAKQGENPLADVVNVQLRNSTSYRIGPNERTQNLLDLQPIVPLRLTARLRVMALASLPLVWNPDVTRPTGITFGLGDIALSMLLSSSIARVLHWGIGPAFRFPTGTNERLGRFDSGQFSLGPTAGLALTPRHVVLGFVVSNVWSVVGRESGSTVRSFVLQPMMDYNLPSGWYLVTTPIIVSDWTASAAERWLVPVGGGFGRAVLLGRANGALNFEAQAFWNAVRPTGGPPWSLRLQVSFFLPKLVPRSQ